MNTIIILLTQTKNAATIEILLLLTGAAIIGYVTAWLYTRSVYNKNLKAVEAELSASKSQVSNLNIVNSTQQKMLDSINKENEKLESKRQALKTLNKKAEAENDNMTLKVKQTQEMLDDKDEELLIIAQSRHLMDYNSFGAATEDEKDDLQTISGIGPFIEKGLHALGIFTFLQISKFTKRDIGIIENAILYFSGRIERDEWVSQAKELILSEKQKSELLKRIRARKSKIYYTRIGIATENEADDLTAISGIGKWINKKLNALAIFTFEQISRFTEDDAEEVTEAIEYFPGRIERDEWVYQAKELIRMEGKKADLLKRIKERKVILSYNNLGIARKHQANNLTLIEGISLWIEERLNILEIYTFEQISRLKTKDVELISGILGLLPNRIEKEAWVSQALEFEKKRLVIKRPVLEIKT